MKTNQTPLRRLAGAFARQLQLAAALGSWTYRAPYPWEFELVNARWPRPTRATASTPPSAETPACCFAAISAGSATCGGIAS